MPLKLTCPDCGQKIPLDEPYPLPGSALQCPHCATSLAVTYPPGVIDKLHARGKAFREEPSSSPRRGVVPPVAQPPVPPNPSTEAGTVVDATEPGVAMWSGINRTVPSARTPYGALPGNLPEPEHEPKGQDPSTMTRRRKLYSPTDAGKSADEPAATTPPAKKGSSAPGPKPKRSRKAKKAKKAKKGGGGFRIFRWVSSLGAVGCLGILGLGVLVGLLSAGGGYWYYSRDLPSIETLRAYKPPTVTIVYDHKGELLGEIYEQRRYVVPLEEIPDSVKHAFIAAEDASFYEHGGVDFIGLTRAMIKNIQQGRLAQGASTITQQVTRNFLLTKDKKIERKIKEMILAWRIEDVYTKDHILYLYLNEIYLGSGTYGVEAASRVYFGKSARELTVAEAAMIAGLPQRPSEYSPHRHFEKARERQEYVVNQMVRNDYLTEAEAKAELARDIVVIERGNEFLDKAPHFTEYVRRYLVETYGHDKVYNEGLQVTTTCDLDLQSVGQAAVVTGVHDVDQRMGFRRAAITEVSGDAAIKAKRAEIDLAIREAWAKEQDPAGRIPVPAKATLVPDRVYDAVITEVGRNYIALGIGNQEAIVPLDWARWVYEPNPKRSWRYRTQNNLTESVDTDGDRKKDGAIVRKGDVVLAKVVNLSSKDKEVAKSFKGTPGESKAVVAARLWQVPEVEGALFSYDLHTGAVRAMVGGADFERSEFNRAIQSRRQVGSTFKPIVYAAAIDSKKQTSASMVADAPLAFAAQNADFIWKPANYGHDYLGNITLRKALALSRNTCTVRVLETIDPGMNDDVIYEFARALGIGGPPSHQLPADWVVQPETDLLCPWIREDEDFTICMDRFPPKDPEISNTRHRQLLGPDDEYWCRACDMSMGLGSASLTMEELARAYSTFATGGNLVEPYYIEEVTDRYGEVLEKHSVRPPVQVMDPGVARIVNWLLQGVVNEGTGAAARRLGLQYLGGKTGTTNDEKDTWFVGFTNDVITTAWVGYDQPRSLGVSSTGGRTALPIWMEYMRAAAPKDKDRPFPAWGEVEWALIDENTGSRVTAGGRSYPFLKDTAPESTGAAAGQVSIDQVTDI